MSPWQHAVTVIVLSLYFGAWWLVVDVITRGERSTFWHFSMVALLSVVVPVFISDLTFRYPILLWWLVVSWLVLPFVFLAVLARSGQLSTWVKSFLRDDHSKT